MNPLRNVMLLSIGDCSPCLIASKFSSSNWNKPPPSPPRMAPHSGRAINRVKQFNSTLSTLNFYRYRCWLGLFFLFMALEEPAKCEARLMSVQIDKWEFIHNLTRWIGSRILRRKKALARCFYGLFSKKNNCYLVSNN